MRFSAGVIMIALLIAQTAPSFAQANADPGSAMMGGAKAQEHEEQKNRQTAMKHDDKPAPMAPHADNPKDPNARH